MTESFLIEDALKALQKYWNYSNFRERQAEVINNLSRGENLIALLPTGGGKSICYQIPAILHTDLSIVISPLISLMEDQVSDLKSRNIRAEAIHSGHTWGNIDRILDNCVYGDIKILYVSPERLQHPLFKERVLKMNISLVAVDEAHCISQWGHDFRPSYLEISQFIDEVSPKQIIALTATATDKVLSELVKLIFRRPPVIIKGSFRRDNISIRIKETEDKIGVLLKLCAQGYKTIIYVRSRRQVQMIAKTLTNHGRAAAYYHAGLSFKEKSKIQERFKLGKLQIVAATNAFGMGIDISDIQRVIHFDIPPSIEEYYQEIGRAGRDGKLSYADFLIGKNDKKYNKQKVKDSFPPLDFANKVYKFIHVHFNIGLHEGEGMTKPVKIEKLASKFGIPNKKLINALRLWQKLGVWEVVEDARSRTYCAITLSPQEIRKEENRLEDSYFVLDYFMRHYEQLFTGWIQLDIERDAKRMKIPLTELNDKLDYLCGLKYLKIYKLEPGTKINFLKNRISSHYLEEFKLKYDHLKKMSEERSKGISGFLESQECRMSYILSYFGEIEHKNCGMCDICNAHLKLDNVTSDIEIQRRYNEQHALRNQHLRNIE